MFYLSKGLKREFGYTSQVTWLTLIRTKTTCIANLSMSKSVTAYPHLDVTENDLSKLNSNSTAPLPWRLLFSSHVEISTEAIVRKSF